MSNNPNHRKNGGKGTFFGNLLRGIATTGKKVGAPILDAISGGKVSDIVKAISGDNELTEAEKEMLLKELEQDVIEMQEVTKRWQSDMQSDSWLSKNIRPLTLTFLVLFLAITIVLESSIVNFKVDPAWKSLLNSLLLVVIGGYFGARSVEKVTKMRKGGE